MKIKTMKSKMKNAWRKIEEYFNPKQEPIVYAKVDGQDLSCFFHVEVCVHQDGLICRGCESSFGMTFYYAGGFFCADCFNKLMMMSKH